MTKKKNNVNFEASLNRLEEISSLLDGEDVGLEEAIKLYEEGITLSKKCSEILKNAEIKITELKKDLNNIEENHEMFDE